MKTIFLAFFLLFAFSTTRLSTTAQFVYDTDSNPLNNGGSYHIVPVFRGRGGGLKLAKTGNETCPLTVVQARSDLDPGLPANLASPVFSLDITEGIPLFISFAEVPDCVPKPSQWGAVKEFPIGWPVEVASHETVHGPFRIEKYDKYGSNDYKLVFCRREDSVCGDLGIHNRRLVVRDGNPFIVHFQKATEKSAN
ncbi:hypothetical protein L6164_002653 [Bauhinia variegata]|uniref:Uncharacterized protein n=2 Tax=Bauhinia variegata TaxID=167791 RepID=A0ACB9PYQ1_BAUVA|nr:hypothetical protein L6164_002628 [Bauhinia variegata]KAI4353722.1 hypothetical protein L6164_002653 [Bauhinia variegata]